MGHCGETSFAHCASAWNEALVLEKSVMSSLLRAMAQDLAMHYGQQPRIWLRAMGHSAELVLCYGPKRQTSDYSAELHNSILKACHFILRDSDAEKCVYRNSINEDLYHPSLTSLASTNKIMQQRPITQNEFRTRITQQIRNRVRKKIRL
jgi:hypothetical protein